MKPKELINQIKTKVDFKDKKFIMPLMLVIPLIIVGYSVYSIVGVSSKVENSEVLDSAKKGDIMGVPVGEVEDLSSRSDVMNEAYKDQMDRTAVTSLEDTTLLRAINGESLYSEAEKAYLDSIERSILRDQELRNRNLGQQTDGGYNTYPASGYASEPVAYPTAYGAPTAPPKKEEDKAIAELKMYQKILNGEEILSPEEEKKRDEERIRADERQKIKEELAKESFNTVEKARSTLKNGFNSISTKSSSTDNDLDQEYIKAMVSRTTKVSDGSRIRLQLLEDIKINGNLIKSGSEVYAQITGFSGQRISASVSSIICNGRPLKVNLSVLDNDGTPGFFVPANVLREIGKRAGTQALGNSNNLSITTSPESLTGMAVQALQSAYQATTQAIGQGIAKDKATIKYNTIVYLQNKKNN